MDIYYNNKKVSSVPILPENTIGQIKTIIHNWLSPIKYSLKLLFNDGVELSPLVFTTNNYDNVNFIQHASQLNGSSIFVIPQAVNVVQTQVTQTAKYQNQPTPKLPKSRLYIPKNKMPKNTRYDIIDNGGPSYTVVSKNNRLYINDLNPGKLVRRVDNFEGYWPGYDSEIYEHGNSVLIKITNNSYYYVGSEIYSFNTTDVIYDFASTMGNSRVPYPVAFGTTYLYFMLDAEKVDKKEFQSEVYLENAEELYSEYYGYVKRTKDLNKIPMNVRMIRRR